ncbi:unnamed protein product [Bursaphelenchus okinawaensis]|uniref:Gustatory receptor n=1 Tax=Bursaphelenchus okinawaensis TaxID=465554 RepID=A0A811K5A5_9BILA|nr:unnamed protein product [Bursaphelenchus okinawaensis]CAG9091550.1 unnamed protein product [Bursaphelenchus okinawaensis]
MGDLVLPTYEQIKSSKVRMGFLMYALRITGLMYKHKVNEGWERPLRAARAGILIIVVFLHLLNNFWQVFEFEMVHKERSLVIFFWLLQSFMSMCFLVWWQYKGRTALLIHILPWSDLKQSYQSRRKVTLLVYFGIAGLVVIMSVFAFIGNMLYPDNPVIDRAAVTPFPNFLRFVSYFIVNYAYTVWGAVLTLYCLVLVVIHEEIRSLNTSIQEAGQSPDHLKLVDELLILHDRHANICYVLQEADATFQVYNFSMLTANIPTAIFTILSCYHAFASSDKFNISMCLMEAIFCVVETLGLTTMPSKINTALQNTEKAIYNNRKLWKPYQADVYNLLQSFITQNKQPGLGMSAWGFAIVSKSLILTTVSLVVTYLTLLIQLSDSPGEAGELFKRFLNSTNHANSTVD